MCENINNSMEIAEKMIIFYINGRKNLENCMHMTNLLGGYNVYFCDEKDFSYDLCYFLRRNVIIKSIYYLK